MRSILKGVLKRKRKIRQDPVFGFIEFLFEKKESIGLFFFRSVGVFDFDDLALHQTIVNGEAAFGEGHQHQRKNDYENFSDPADQKIDRKEFDDENHEEAKKYLIGGQKNAAFPFDERAFERLHEKGLPFFRAERNDQLKDQKRDKQTQDQRHDVSAVKAAVRFLVGFDLFQFFVDLVFGFVIGFGDGFVVHSLRFFLLDEAGLIENRQPVLRFDLIGEAVFFADFHINAVDRRDFFPGDVPDAEITEREEQNEKDDHRA